MAGPESSAEIGVPTMTPVAFGRTGSNPARIRSFLITEELTGTTSLEDFCAAWASQPPPFRLRQALTSSLPSSYGRCTRTASITGTVTSAIFIWTPRLRKSGSRSEIGGPTDCVCT